MKPNWYKIADNINEIGFSEEGMATIEVGIKKICLVLLDKELFACQSACPHAGGDLSRGYIDATGKIVCPVHGYKFDIKNGRNTSGEGYYLKHYPVEIRSEGIFVGLADL